MCESAAIAVSNNSLVLALPNFEATLPCISSVISRYAYERQTVIENTDTTSGQGR
jgi:hypothetical protein